MNSNHYSHSTIETLPRIQSYKKLHRPPSEHHTQADRPETTEEQPTISINSLRRPRSHSNLHSARKALQSVNSSKAVKLEATAVIYLKKIEALEKQDFMLQKEINQAKKEIEQLRLKRKTGEQPTQSSVSSRVSSTNFRENPKQKLDNLRKKIDRQNQKTKKTMMEVDKTRREIQTLKKVNGQMESQLQVLKQNLENEHKNVGHLQSKIADMNQLIHKKKIDQIHQKTQIVKEYEAILKRLDNELADNPQRLATDSPQFYITDLNHNSSPLPQLPNQPRPSSKTSKAQNISVQTSFLKSKASEWQNQLQNLKDKLQVESHEQLQSKINEQHKKNYQMYNYLNERYRHLDEVRERYQDLLKRKQAIDLLKTGQSKRQAVSEELIQKIQTCRKKSKVCQRQLQQIEGMYQKLKEFVLSYAAKTGTMSELNGNDIQKDKLSFWLQKILRSQKTQGKCQT